MSLSLAEARKSGPPRLAVTKCALGKWLRTLDSTDLDDARVILERGNGWSNPDITDLFSNNGCEGLSKSTVGEHRRGACACEPI